MATTTPRGSSPADASPSDLGRRLRAVRESQGLSRTEVARSAGLTRRELAAYERGRNPFSYSDLWCLAGSCGVEVEDLLPERDRLGVASDLGALTVGDRTRRLPSYTDPDGVLREYLDLVYELRNLSPGTRPSMREEDLATLADALGGTPEVIEARLHDLIGASHEEAARLRAMILAAPPSPAEGPAMVDSTPAAALVTPPVAVVAPPEAVVPAPAMPPQRSTDRFVPAGRAWEIGGGGPAVAVADSGALAMRRTEGRWALADLTAARDFTVRATVDCTGGVGFGILFRAFTAGAGCISGYSFDLDPIASGGGFLLRQWSAGAQVGRPLAHAPVPDLADLYGAHVIEVSLHDDTLTARVDNALVLRVDGLRDASVAVGHAPCYGERVGVHAWSTTDVVVHELMVAPH